MNRNYSLELEKLMKDPANKGKKLFLHSCCAPCSSYVLEYLCRFFRITVFYYNPNITADDEYGKRVEEQKRLIKEMNEQSQVSARKVSEQGEGIECHADTLQAAYPIEIIEGDYDKNIFFESVKGLEQCKEGGERCFVCYELRLRETARRAKEAQADYFTTTLTISPLKNAQKLNEIGEKLAKEYGTAFLPSDFKKKGGYRRSVELSKEYDLYRQDYCGCVFSKTEREAQKTSLAKSKL